MLPQQNAIKRNLISFAIAFTTAVVAMSIQQSRQDEQLISEQLEASILIKTPLIVKE